MTDATGDESWLHETVTPEALGDGFRDHGSVGFRCNVRGWVSSHDGAGNDVVLVWLCDESAGWLGMITIDTEEFQEFRPEDRSVGAPFASLLSRQNRYYACNKHFVEFDPTVPGFSFVEPTVDTGDALAMSMTEDQSGVIWAANYPEMTLVSYNPDTGTFRHYGTCYEHPSSMYPRSIATDDTGWIYIGLKPAAGQLLVLDRDTGTSEPVLARNETPADGPVAVTRATDGTVYGQAGDRWFRLSDGTATELDDEPTFTEADEITGSQALAHRELPSGREVTELAAGVPEPYVHITDPTDGSETRVRFDPSGGDVIPMRLTVAPDGSIVGGTSLPVQVFRLEPVSGAWQKANNTGQWNVITPAADAVYIGQYPTGALLRWEPTAPWEPFGDNERDLSANPAFLAHDSRHVHRPFTVLVHPNGRDVLLGGQPDYGFTGGGLLRWDRHTERATVHDHASLIEHEIPRALTALSDGTVIGGTDTRPAGGGVQHADVATLFRLDLPDCTIPWSAPVLDGVERYQDLTATPDDLVIGIADRDRLFAFDPATRTVVHDTRLDGDLVDHQSPHVLVSGPDDHLFVLFRDGRIGAIDPATFDVTIRGRSPAPIRNGGGIRDNRLFFATDTQVYSWEIPTSR